MSCRALHAHLLRNGKLSSKRLLSITQAMGDVQKKLQELSDSYQSLQGGEKLNPAGKQALMVA